MKPMTIVSITKYLLMICINLLLLGKSLGASVATDYYYSNLVSFPSAQYIDITNDTAAFTRPSFNSNKFYKITSLNGFKFSFNGKVITNFFISANGYICFNSIPTAIISSPLTATSGQGMPSATYVIAPFASNLNRCTVAFRSNADALTIQWSDCCIGSNYSDNFNFKIILHSDNSIDVNYGNIHFDGNSNPYQAGLRGSSGDVKNGPIAQSYSTFSWINPTIIQALVKTITNDTAAISWIPASTAYQNHVIDAEVYNAKQSKPVSLGYSINGVLQVPVTMSYDYTNGSYKRYHATLPPITAQHAEVTYFENYTTTQGYNINAGHISFEKGSLKVTPLSYAASYNAGTGNIALSHSQTVNGVKLRAACSHSPIKITQVTLDLLATGKTLNYPNYVVNPSNIHDKDLVEIRNLSGTPLDISGFTFIFESHNEVRTYKIHDDQFALGAFKTLIFDIGDDSATPDDSSNHFYNIGGANNPLTSSDGAGFILKNAAGDIIDAVAVNGFEFDGSQGEAPSDWYGLPGDSSVGKAGFIRNNRLDLNCSSDWLVASSSHKQTIGAIYFPLDSAFEAPFINWHSNVYGNFSGEYIDLPPLNNGNYDFTTTVTGDSDVATASLHINVHAPVNPSVNFYADSTNPFVNETVFLYDISGGYPIARQWAISPSTFAYINGTNSNSKNPVIQFTAPGLYKVGLVVANADAIDSLILVDYIAVKQYYEQATKLWGTTKTGGDNGAGVIFNMNVDGSAYTVVYSFTQATGSGPNGSLIKSSNGLLYGTAALGGSNNLGVLFSFDPVTYHYTDVLNFNGTQYGSYPGAGLIQASNGLLYGTTSDGGNSNLGTIFSYNPSNGLFAKVRNFGFTTGSRPWHSGLVQASNGLLYGVASNGGANGSGVIYSLNTTGNVYSKVHEFNPLNCESANPDASLIQASDGLLYGTTLGPSTCAGVGDFSGSMFSFNPANNQVQTVVYFGKDSTNDGSNPRANVTEYNGI
ncbi:MAG: choice-of-anchor tandem repeat GloVer-containing protein, partial [Bacteroidia bacterium]